MKPIKVLNLLTVSALLVVTVVGCKNPDKGITPIHGHKVPPPGGNLPPGLPLDGGRPIDGGAATGSALPSNVGGIPMTGDRDLIEGMIPDRETFKSETVYFDFDRHSVKTGEKSKVEAVATYFRNNRTDKLQIEGHCDERGTEEYNRALGEKRAQSLREYLTRLGVGADRILTKSLGEDQPAVPGHDEAAWSKNRRGEFVLLKPKP